MFCYVSRFVKMFSGFEVDRGPEKKFHPRVSSGLRREKKDPASGDFLSGTNPGGILPPQSKIEL